MKFLSMIIGILTSTFFIIPSCTQIGKKPTKCECKTELDKNLENTALTGNVETSDLGKECDLLYGGVEGYMYEKCIENK